MTLEEAKAIRACNGRGYSTVEFIKALQLTEPNPPKDYSRESKEMIKEDYVSFETAKLLKEKGFDWECFQYWHEEDNELVHSQSMHPIQNISNPCFFGPAAPTLQMAMKWLREEKDVQIEIAIVGTDTWESPTKWMYGFRCQTKDVIDRRNADFSSYEEACEVGIRYCLENLI